MSRGGPSPLAAAPPGPAAAPTAAASGAAGAGRPKAPTSLSAPLLRAAHLTAETTTLQETEQTRASLSAVSKYVGLSEDNTGDASKRRKRMKEKWQMSDHKSYIAFYYDHTVTAFRSMLMLDLLNFG